MQGGIALLRRFKTLFPEEREVLGFWSLQKKCYYLYSYSLSNNSLNFGIAW
jgi:hypothetical protein